MATPARKRARVEPGKAQACGAVQPLSVPDAKAIVDELKAKLKLQKFYPGSHAEACSLKFATPRFPADKAGQLLGVGEDGKPTARTFGGEHVAQLLRLKPGALKGTLFKKPHRWSKPGSTAA